MLIIYQDNRSEDLFIISKVRLILYTNDDWLSVEASTVESLEFLIKLCLCLGSVECFHSAVVLLAGHLVDCAIRQVADEGHHPHQSWFVYGRAVSVVVQKKRVGLQWLSQQILEVRSSNIEIELSPDGVIAVNVTNERQSVGLDYLQIALDLLLNPCILLARPKLSQMLVESE